MPVHNYLTTMRLGDAQVGELVCFPNDDPPHGWGFVLSQNADELTVIGALTSNDPLKRETEVIFADSEDSCISYGLDWVFEPLPQAGAITSDITRPAGMWIVQGNTVAMRFARQVMHGGGSVIFDLATFQRVQLNHGHAVGGQFWQIWASEADRHDPHRKPLLCVPHQAPDR